MASLNYTNIEATQKQFRYNFSNLLEWENTQWPIFEEYVSNVDEDILYKQDLKKRVSVVNIDIRDILDIIFGYIYPTGPNFLPSDKPGKCYKLNLTSMLGLGICVSTKVLYYSEWEVCTHLLTNISTDKQNFIQKFGHQGRKGECPNLNCWDVLKYLPLDIKEGIMWDEDE